jgi:RNA polymerase sigma-70 factor (ECF subfamily)
MADTDTPKKTFGRAVPSASERLAVSTQERNRLERNRLFEQMAVRVGPKALGVVRSLLPDPTAAEDVVQIAFEKAYRALDTFRGEARIDTWFMRIVVNTAHRQGRKWKWRRRLKRDLKAAHKTADAVPLNLGSVNRPDHRLHRLAVAEHLRTAVDTLPRRQRTAFVLRHMHEMSTAETAAVMDCAPGTVKATLKKAVDRLRRVLGEGQKEPER